LDQAIRDNWIEFAAGRRSEDDAQVIDIQLRARQASQASRYEPLRRLPVSVYRPRRYPCSPDRWASRQRRRVLSSQFPAPPQIRACFSPAEAAALTIIAGEVRDHGYCDLSIDVIGRRAGVCRATVQNAFREAVRLGLIIVRQRPQGHGTKNRTNVITIISNEWLQWLKYSREGKLKRFDRIKNQEKKEAQQEKQEAWVTSERAGQPQWGAA
jgi:hypothetical protein